MVELNMMEEEFCARRMAERKRATYFVMQREMACEEYKEKREEERARKREKARHAKEAYARGGERALMKGKWPGLKDYFILIVPMCYIELVMHFIRSNDLY
jgi:hypothetical protein